MAKAAAGVAASSPRRRASPKRSARGHASRALGGRTRNWPRQLSSILPSHGRVALRARPTCQRTPPSRRGPAAVASQQRRPSNNAKFPTRRNSYFQDDSARSVSLAAARRRCRRGTWWPWARGGGRRGPRETPASPKGGARRGAGGDVGGARGRGRLPRAEQADCDSNEGRAHVSRGAHQARRRPRQAAHGDAQGARRPARAQRQINQEAGGEGPRRGARGGHVRRRRRRRRWWRGGGGAGRAGGGHTSTVAGDESEGGAERRAAPLPVGEFRPPSGATPATGPTRAYDRQRRASLTE